MAIVIEDPETRRTAKTRKAAEDAVKRAYSTKLNLQYDDEDEVTDRDDARVVRKREKHGEFLSLDEFQRWWHTGHR